jgi:hypothetical protein
MSDEVRCRQCQKIVTAEAISAFEETRYLGYNIMSIQYAQEQTEGTREGFLWSYVCKQCKAARG